jgi:hypothetical protein
MGFCGISVLDIWISCRFIAENLVVKLKMQISDLFKRKNLVVKLKCKFPVSLIAKI